MAGTTQRNFQAEILQCKFPLADTVHRARHAHHALRISATGTNLSQEHWTNNPALLKHCLRVWQWFARCLCPRIFSCILLSLELGQSLFQRGEFFRKYENGFIFKSSCKSQNVLEIIFPSRFAEMVDENNGSRLFFHGLKTSNFSHFPPTALGPLLQLSR